MKIEKNTTTNVTPKGTIEHEMGAVVINGSIRMSAPEGGCGNGNCNCSPGHWLTIVLPRTESGKVESIKVSFDGKEERDHFFDSGQIDL